MKHLPTFTRWHGLTLLLIAVSPIVFSDAARGSSLRKSAIVRAVADASPAIVNIHGQKTINGSQAGFATGDGPRRVNGMGTGVIVDPRGYIVTNFHVVDGVREIKVSLSDRSSFVATLVAHDPKTDLAIIKIPTNRVLPLIRIGTSRDLMEGEEVIAVGNAYGYEHTVTRGIISALHRTVQVSDSQQYSDLIQTDASINPGNSGGPLLNIDGDMIGINVAVRVGAQGIGFAIPVDEAMDVAARLMSVERAGKVWHGVVSAESGRTAGTGVLTRSVQADSPAEKAGVRPGDIITQINNVRVERALDLERAMIGLNPGDDVRVTVQRQDQTQQIAMTLAPSSRGRAVSPEPATSSDVAWDALGVQLREVDSQELSGSKGPFHGGLRVTRVKSGSPADRQGVRIGDILVGLHRWETASMHDLNYVLNNSDVAANESVRFYVLRDNETLYGSLPVSWIR